MCPQYFVSYVELAEFISEHLFHVSILLINSCPPTSRARHGARLLGHHRCGQADGLVGEAYTHRPAPSSNSGWVLVGICVSVGVKGR